MSDTQNRRGEFMSNIFQYEGKQFRTVIQDGEPWFVANDVCEILDFANPSETLKRLDEDEVNSTEVIDTLGRKQNTNVVNEAGLYSLVLGSRKPEAKQFKRWVTHEVLPAIRKHGAYMTPEALEKVLLNPDTIIQLAQTLKSEQEKSRQLAATIETNKPKVIFAESVEASKTSILIGDLAKLIKQNGHDTGQKRLFEWLRDNGYLIKSGQSKNMPTQKAMSMSLFEVKESTVNNPDGSIRVTKTTKVTGKGQIYFINLFKKEAS
jgi:anti-repressor protein